MAVTRDQVAKLYVANFNRAPDAAGLDYWISDGTSATTTLTDLNAIAASMQAGAEASTGVASMTNSEYVISLYSSMFGRTVAADSADVAYWTNDITLGNVTRANMIQTLILGAEASTGSATDAAVLSNKTTVGLAYADAGLNGTFSVATVTADTATVDAAQADIDASITTAGQSFALTTGMETLTGTANADTFYGIIDGATTTTLNAYDTINGGVGADTLNMTLSGGSFDGSTTLTSIEKFIVKASGAGRTVETNGLTLTSVTMDRSTEDVTVNNIATPNTAIGASNMSEAQTLTANYVGAALTGTTDSVTVNLSNVATAATVAIVSTTTSGIEEIVVSSTGNTNKLTALTSVDSGAATEITKVTVTGDKALTITTALDYAGTTTGTFDASAATGAVTVGMDVNLTQATVKGGSGYDVIDMSTGLNATDVI